MSVPYKKQYTNLLRQMDPSSVRGLCFEKFLISAEERNKLFLDESYTEKHNIRLLTILERSPKKFLVFRDEVLPEDEIKSYKDIVDELRKFQCKCFRSKTNSYCFS